jgi:acyl carrier protein
VSRLAFSGLTSFALMKPATLAVAAKPATSGRDEALRNLPPAAQAAFQHFLDSGDTQALDLVILAILEDFIPHASARPLSELPGKTLLMKDLGFDSLAIAEVVFFTEDLLAIRIANEEIVQVHTLDDLRSFVRSKALTRRAG